VRGLTMTGKLPIKIGFQGGGAKLLPMLATVDAIQELISSGEIVVEGVSGTSAGAISAAVLAQGYSARETAFQLTNNADDFVNRIAGFSKSKIRLALRLATTIPFSRPVAHIQELKSILTQVFTSIDASFSTDKKLGDISIPIKIMVSNLVKADSVELCSRETPNESLIEALVDSCALPIFFRSQSSLSGTARVDGGLYSNLPMEPLMKGDSDNLIGVSFSPPLSEPNIKTTTHYMAHLLLSTIDQSVKRSATMVGTEDIFQIDTELSTLDFASAGHWCPGQKEYEEVKKQSLTWLKKYISRKNAVQGSRGIDDLLRSNNSCYEILSRQTPRENISCGIVATVNVLAPRGDARHRHYTEMKVKQRFRALNAPISACSVSSPNFEGQEKIAKFHFQVRDHLGNEVDHHQIPSIKSVPIDGTDTEIAATVIYFEEPLLPGDDRWYEVINTDYDRGGLIALSDKHSGNPDRTIGVANSQVAPFTEGYIIMQIPEEFPELNAESLNNVDFRELTPSEILSFGGEAPGGFRSKGWIASDIKRHEQFILVLKFS